MYICIHTFLLYCTCVYIHVGICVFLSVCLCVWLGQRTIYENWFSPSTLVEPTSLDLLKKYHFFSGDAGQWWNTWLVCTGPGPVRTLQIKACQLLQKLDSHFLTQLWGCSSPDRCHHSSECSSYPVSWKHTHHTTLPMFETERSKTSGNTFHY